MKLGILNPVVDPQKARPIRNMVVLRVDPDPDVSSGGLRMITIERPVLLRATVIKVGDGRHLDKRNWGQRLAVDVKPGDRVLINRSAAYAVLSERDAEKKESELVMVREDQIEAVIEGEAA